MAKVDKEALRREFLTGEYATLTDFALAKGVKYSYIMTFSQGWLAEKARLNKEITEESLIKNKAKMIEETVQTAEEARASTLRGLNKIKQIAERRLTEIDGGAQTTAMELNYLASAYYRVNDTESRLIGIERITNDDSTKIIAEAVLSAARKVSECD